MVEATSAFNYRSCQPVVKFFRAKHCQLLFVIEEHKIIVNSWRVNKPISSSEILDG
jgi:hypothetical protein